MLNAFLSQARKELPGNASDGTPVAVMGSSAADLDSVVSCLAYAYLLHVETGASIRVLPFVPIPREDLHLLPEAVFLLGKTETHYESLILADEVDLVVLLLRAVLLDTANLDPNAGRDIPRVVDIIHRLMEIVGESSSIEYNDLVRSRTSVDGLTNNQLLRKEYKEDRVGSVRSRKQLEPIVRDLLQADER